MLEDSSLISVTLHLPLIHGRCDLNQQVVHVLVGLDGGAAARSILAGAPSPAAPTTTTDQVLNVGKHEQLGNGEEKDPTALAAFQPCPKLCKASGLFVAGHNQLAIFFLLKIRLTRVRQVAVII